MESIRRALVGVQYPDNSRAGGWPARVERLEIEVAELRETVEQLQATRKSSRRLTDELVAKIRAKYLEGASALEVATEFDLARSTIRQVLAGTKATIDSEHSADIRRSRGAEVKAARIRRGSLRLTPDKVREIRRLHAEGATGTELAEQYRVAPSVISNVIKRINWADVD